MASKIEECEALYRFAGQPALFKFTPFVPPAMDGLLEDRGKHWIEPFCVMELNDLSAVPEPTNFEIRMETEINWAWVQRLMAMKGIPERHGLTTMKLFDRSLLTTVFFTVCDQGMAVACGYWGSR